MIDERQFEALLKEALGRAGAPAPFPVDVTPRVMARIEELGTPAAAEIGLRQFVRWTLAASIVGGAMLTAAFWNGPSLHDLAAAAGHGVAAGTAAAIKLSAPFGAVVAAFGRIGRALMDSAHSVVGALAPFQILARALLTVTAAAMVAITAFVVVRDVRVGVAQQKELR